MKVLHLIPSFTGGGAERQLSLLAPELCKLGVDTHIAYIHSGVNLPPLLDSPVELHRIPCRGNHDPVILLRLIGLMRSIRPDLVQTWLPQMDIFGGVAARLSGIPFILSERSSALAYPGGWKIWLRRQTGRGARAVVANSEGGVEYWRGCAAGLRLVRNGMPLELIASATPQYLSVFGFPEASRVILFAGRLTPEKNIVALLGALDVVLESCEDCVALLFGEGDMEEEIRAHIAGMKSCGRVRLSGFATDLWRWMRRASAFVSVSRFEGNPNAVLEAMATGCPLVISDIPQHREILDESAARFCDPASEREIAEAILAVLDNPQKAASLGVNAEKLAQSYSIETAALNYLEIYREFTKGKK